MGIEYLVPSEVGTRTGMAFTNCRNLDEDWAKEIANSIKHNWNNLKKTNKKAKIQDGLDSPVKIAKDDKGRYVSDGQHRHRAIELLVSEGVEGSTEKWPYIYDSNIKTHLDSLEVSLRSNLYSRQMKDAEIGQALTRLNKQDSVKYDHASLAAIFGKSEQWAKKHIDVFEWVMKNGKFTDYSEGKLLMSDISDCMRSHNGKEKAANLSEAREKAQQEGRKKLRKAEKAAAMSGRSSSSKTHQNTSNSAPQMPNPLAKPVNKEEAKQLKNDREELKANSKENVKAEQIIVELDNCLLYTSPSPRDRG